MASPPVTTATDYEQLVMGWTLGDDAFTHPGAKGAEAWRIFWDVARDFGVEQIAGRKVQTQKPFSTFRDWLGHRKADELAKRGAEVHPSNAQQAQLERERTHQQTQVARYISWINDCLVSRGTRSFWQPETVTAMETLLQGGQRAAVFLPRDSADPHIGGHDGEVRKGAWCPPAMLISREAPGWYLKPPAPQQANKKGKQRQGQGGDMEDEPKESKGREGRKDATQPPATLLPREAAAVHHCSSTTQRTPYGKHKGDPKVDDTPTTALPR